MIFYNNCQLYGIINTKRSCFIVDDDTKEEANNVCASSSSSSSSSSCSRLFTDILRLLLHRDTSCCLDNRYFGHNSHLLLHYKKKKRKYGLLCEDLLFYKCYHIVWIVRKIVRCTAVLTVDTFLCDKLRDPNPVGRHSRW